MGHLSLSWSLRGGAGTSPSFVVVCPLCGGAISSTHPPCEQVLTAVEGVSVLGSPLSLARSRPSLAALCCDAWCFLCRGSRESAMMWWVYGSVLVCTLQASHSTDLPAFLSPSFLVTVHGLTSCFDREERFRWPSSGVGSLAVPVI